MKLIKFYFLTLLITHISTNDHLMNQSIQNADLPIYNQFLTMVNSFNLKMSPNRLARKKQQSLSILMNFGFDGTTSLIFMDSSKDGQILWTDSGNCLVGSIYDPIINSCREIFCMKGFELSKSGCTPISNTNNSLSNSKISNEMLIELSLNFLTTDLLPKGLNETLIKERILETLDLNEQRLQHFKVISNRVLNKTANSMQQLQVSFKITDKLIGNSDEKETITLYFLLIAYGISETALDIDGLKCYITDVREIRSQAVGWCEQPGDEMSFFFSNFRILVESSPTEAKKYFIYVSQTRRLYQTGDYVLSMVLKNRTLNLIEPIENDSLLAGLNNLIDVTDLILGNSAGDTFTLLSVCDRAPKINRCTSNMIVKMHKCEFDFDTVSRAFCLRSIKSRCLTIDEYELDGSNIDYIGVCQQDQLRIEETDDETAVSSIEGTLSSVAIIISLVFMILTLITYMLFKSLRNIPGWNIMNLTVSLAFAQLFLLLGSTINKYPLVCFIHSIITHYGFLTSFCWMNIISIDLYKNFGRKSRHVLLRTLSAKERLPKYLLYGWLAPLIVIAASVATDFGLTSSSFKPCYASYLNGCFVDLNSSLRSHTYNQSLTAALNATSDCLQRLQNNNSSQKVILTRYCWINNERANFVFFIFPIAVIIVINGVLFFKVIVNIRKMKAKQQKLKMRRFSRVKIPGDEDVKFYFQMSILMGFTWVIGFFLPILSSKSSETRILQNILKYVFILLNLSMGIFIFFVFIFRENVKLLYKNLFNGYCATQSDKVSSNLRSDMMTKKAKSSKCLPKIFLISDKHNLQFNELRV